METGRSSYSNRVLEVPALHRDGHEISIAFSVSLIFGDGPSRSVAQVVAVVREETERWNERRALRDELDRLRNAARRDGVGDD